MERRTCGQVMKEKQAVEESVEYFWKKEENNGEAMVVGLP